MLTQQQTQMVSEIGNGNFDEGVEKLLSTYVKNKTKRESRSRQKAERVRNVKQVLPRIAGRSDNASDTVLFKDLLGIASREVRQQFGTGIGRVEFQQVLEDAGYLIKTGTDSYLCVSPIILR